MSDFGTTKLLNLDIITLLVDFMWSQNWQVRDLFFFLPFVILVIFTDFNII